MAESFLEGYKRHQARNTEALMTAIRDAVYPFDPGIVTLMIEEWYQGEPGTRRLHVGFGNWRSLGTIIDISDMDLAMYPDSATALVAQKIHAYLRELPYIEPGSNVQLGEN